jgi:hypothetical protein
MGWRSNLWRLEASLSQLVGYTSITKLFLNRCSFRMATIQTCRGCAVLPTLYDPCFTREGVQSPQVTLARVNSRAVRWLWYQINFSVNFRVGLVVYIFVGLYLLPEVSTALRCRPLLDSVLPRLPEEASLLVRQKFWLQHNPVPAHYADSIWMRHPIVNTKHGFILDSPPQLTVTCMSKIKFAVRILYYIFGLKRESQNVELFIM